MKTVDLCGPYKLARLDHGEDAAYALLPAFVPEGWLDTIVPEDVRTVLRRYGFISGHYLGKNLDAERWIEESDWMYLRRFTLAPQEGRVFLVLEGVDTLARVYLNGVFLGRCENMFLAHRFDITDTVRFEDTNVLAVRILSPVKEIAGVDRTGLYPQEDTDRLVLRKSQMNYGWDFCGHCLSTGLWKGVRLEIEQDARLGDFYLRTLRIDAGRAALSLDAQVCLMPGQDERELELDVCFDAEGERVLSVSLPSLEAHKAQLTLEHARVWWPRPYGEAFLYDVSLTLRRGMAVLDKKTLRFGIRTVELDQHPLEQGGRAFALKVNGRRLFIRGANWVPLNAVYAEIRDEDYRYYLSRAVDANLSMLRVWGGGIYESELFFDLCDDLGILVMQDFMLACGVLPQTDDYLARVREEVAWAVRRYRNRASLAMWSGDNELDQAYWWYDLQDHFKENRVNRVAVRSSVAENDPYRPFIVSSPCSPFEDEPGGEDPNSPLQGDMHIYLTRFTPESPYYYKKLREFVPRFMSEYGFSSLPCPDSYRKFNFFDSPLDMRANPWLGELEGFVSLEKHASREQLVYFTQLTHAWGLKYFIEYMRAEKGVCFGSLYWKFNDPVAPNRENMLFPSLMSSIDFYGKPKLAYYYARRAYEDVVLAFREDPDGGVALCAVSEELSSRQGMLTVDLVSILTGARVPLFSGEITIAPDASTPLCSFAREQLPKLDAEDEGYLLARFSGGIQMENRFFLSDIARFVGAHWPLATLQAQLTLKAVGDTDTLEATIASDRYAQDVMLSILDADARYSDNAFILDADETRTIAVSLPAAERENRLLQIRAANAQALVFDLNTLKQL